MKQISFVGFIVTPKGVKIAPDEVWINAGWPEPVSHCNIKVFPSFIYSYRRFISSFSCITKLMTDMLKGGNYSNSLWPFLFTPTIILSFAELCNSFTKTSVLADFDPARPICLGTDHYYFAIAGIISQQPENTCNGAEDSTRVQIPSSYSHWHPGAFCS
jgi:hypothetical protein